MLCIENVERGRWTVDNFVSTLCTFGRTFGLAASGCNCESYSELHRSSYEFNQENIFIDTFKYFCKKKWIKFTNGRWLCLRCLMLCVLFDFSRIQNELSMPFHLLAHPPSLGVDRNVLVLWRTFSHSLLLRQLRAPPKLPVSGM